MDDNKDRNTKLKVCYAFQFTSPFLHEVPLTLAEITFDVFKWWPSALRPGSDFKVIKYVCREYLSTCIAEMFRAKVYAKVIVRHFEALPKLWRFYFKVIG